MSQTSELLDVFSSHPCYLWNYYLGSYLLRTSPFPSPPLLPVLPLDPLFLLFFFQSLSRDHPLQAFYHLPKIFHFSHQHRHLCTPLSREHTNALPHLGPEVGAPRAVKLYPAATVSADQMPVGYSFPPCCHDRVDQSSRLSVVFHLVFPLGKCPKVSFLKSSISFL